MAERHMSCKIFRTFFRLSFIPPTLSFAFLNFSFCSPKLPNTPTPISIASSATLLELLIVSELSSNFSVSWRSRVRWSNEEMPSSCGGAPAKRESRSPRVPKPASALLKEFLQVASSLSLSLSLDCLSD
eukprot:TRINITY_DN8339_c0_g1_i1.p1 TRINITY_DN8339_c0_g1~~TRINITY_DN8339_c0_g1_i1.p1  ORF type:complete len:129 (-),score=15.44 TRINITY_DN8339_c0_g1_i1:212-598(-)